MIQDDQAQPMIPIMITQDGAGIDVINSSIVTSFFTNDIQTCVVYCFFGDVAYAVVHDTGQLSISSIAALVSDCGNLSSVKIVCNEFFAKQNGEDAIEEHGKRMRTMLNVVGCKKRPEMIDAQAGAVLVCSDGRCSVAPDFMEILPEIAIRAPDYEGRHAINVINNALSPKNCQNIPVDVQYRCGKFSEMPTLLSDRATAAREMEREGYLIYPDLNRSVQVAIERGIIDRL